MNAYVFLGKNLCVPTLQSSHQLGTQPSGAADVTTGVTAEDDTEEEAEDMVPTPDAEAQRDIQSCKSAC